MQSLVTHRCHSNWKQDNVSPMLPSHLKHHKHGDVSQWCPWLPVTRAQFTLPHGPPLHAECTAAWHVGIGVGGISVYLVNFGVYWIPNIIGELNRDTEIPIPFGFTLYELHL